MTFLRAVKRARRQKIKSLRAALQGMKTHTLAQNEESDVDVSSNAR